MISGRVALGRLLLCLLVLSPVSGLAEDGLKVFRKCAACHEVGADARLRVGPHLNDLFGRPAAAIDGYRYSKAMMKAGADGLVWTEETLVGYLSAPRTYIKGTRMSFAGLRRPTDLDALIVYLKQFSGTDVTGQPAAPGPDRTVLLGATAASLEGDVEWGEYLSGECVTCHQPSGQADGIPAITGWPTDLFIHAIYEYKADIRANSVMQTIAGRLSDEEIAALAAYFGGLEMRQIIQGGEE